MSETVTYLIKRNNSDLYITNKPTETIPTLKYSSDKRDAREFNAMEDLSIDMSIHTAIKKTVTETIEYEEVAYDI